MSNERTILGLVIVGLLAWATTVVAKEADARPVVLGEGKIGRYRWQVGASRDSGAHGGRRPCVSVSLVDLHPEGYPPGLTNESFGKACSKLAVRSAPNVVTGGFGSGSTEVTAVGMAFAPAIEVVRLDLGSLGQRKLALKLLNTKQIQIAGVRQIRYSAFAVVGSFCLRQIVGYSHSGQEIYRGPAESCEGDARASLAPKTRSESS